MISLSDSLAPLKAQFNADQDKTRVVALLSPTWGGCVYGARAVLKLVVQDYANANLSVMVVWIPMLGSDTEAGEKSPKRIEPAEITSLTDSLDTLRDWFNANRDKHRFITLLSPT